MNPPRVFDTVIVGTGFAGLGMSIRLKQAGLNDFIVLERAADLGGTWRDNHYPGCACDVPAHLYSFSFANHARWSQKYAPQPELLAYLKRLAEQHHLLPHIRFHTRLQAAHYDEHQCLWHLQTSQGEILTRTWISATGGLSNPSIPRLPGLPDFQGAVFHSARWDHTIDLRNKRIAVIGTGASAIQFVPQIAPLAQQLDIYQRTPPWILPRHDHPSSRLKQTLFSRLPSLQTLYRWLIYWQHEARVPAMTRHISWMKWPQRWALTHLRKQITNPILRASLTPGYALGCKRVLLSNDWYPALARDNVHLIQQPITAIHPNGLVTADGTVHPADVIILGTGLLPFEPGAPLPILGRQGLSLQQSWSEGAQAYLGTTVSGFPNYFMLTGPNTGLGHSSMVFMIEAQVHYILQALQLLQQGIRSVEVKIDRQMEYNNWLQRKLSRTVWASGCKSWYLDPRTGRNSTLWPSYTFNFWWRTRCFRLQDYHIE